MKYKVGDKIRVVKHSDFPFVIGLEGTVLGIYPLHLFKYYVQLPDFGLPLQECCIEKVIEKGEQLLFSFME